MNPKIIFLDWDGTLADVYPITSQAINQTRAHKNLLPLSNKEMEIQWGWPLERAFPDAADQAIFKSFHQEISEKSPAGRMDGAQELMEYLQTLRSQGIFVGIISNKPHALIEKDIQRFGWTGFFDTIVGSDDTPKRKPDAAALEAALKNYPQPAPSHRDILYLGDTDTDVEFAKNTGIQFIGIGDHITQMTHAGRRVKNLHEAKNQIQTLLRSRQQG
jgi:phosphoglycolate phosphatase